VEQAERLAREFWSRFTESRGATEGRGAIGGNVRFHADMEEQLLGERKQELRSRIGTFLCEYQPNWTEFADLARLHAPLHRDDDHFRRVLSWLASNAFADWLRKRGVPSDVAEQARYVYEFDFEVRNSPS
jgi:hypothetical protein